MIPHLETYLRELRDIRASGGGVNEISGYIRISPALFVN